MPTLETHRAKILKRLTAEGWTLDRHGAGHDLYVHPSKPVVITVPRHRRLKPGTARSISRSAGWH